MAVSAALLYAGKSSAGGGAASTFVTSAVDFVAGRFYLIDIVHVRSGGTPGTTTPTSPSATWDALPANTFNTIAAARTRRVIYRTAFAGTVNEAVTVTMSTDWVSIAVDIVEYSGTVAPGTNGVDAVQQVKTGRADASADFELTFDAPVNSANGLHVHWGSDGIAADTVTLENSLISLSDQSEVSDDLRSVSSWLASAINTFSVSGTSRDVAMMGVEIKAAGSGYGNKLYGPLGGKLVGKV